MKQILFNTDMVRAILDNRKTVTRRVAFPGKDLREFPRKEYPDGWWFRGRAYRNWDNAMRAPQGVMSLCKYCPGDILYVRETWQHGFGGAYLYKASAGYDLFMTPEGELVPDIPWRASIHMPREAARIFLRVTNVRAERLREITLADACKEGGERPMQFEKLWNSTIKPTDLALYGWDANPWVWVIEFERISREEAQIDGRE